MYVVDGSNSAGPVWAFNTRDLMRAAACDHCVNLAVARALNLPGVADLVDPFAITTKNLAMAYGDKFEAEVESELRNHLGDEHFRRPEGTDKFAETVALMQQGVPVIYQGELQHRAELSEFRGRPDFLVRADYELSFVEGRLVANQNPELIGQSGYLAWDAKLARAAKPHYLLQLAIYVDALGALELKAQGGLHGLVLGSRTVELFEESEMVPAMRRARQILEDTYALVAAGQTQKFELANLALHCESESNCKICEYPDLCKKNRKDVDHLVQVAGINKSQIEKLKASGIATMTQLAEATDAQRPADFVPQTFEKLRQQASLQTGYNETGQHRHIVLADPEIAVLPPASANDIFFDMEGFPYFEEKGGLEYLFGAVTRDRVFHSWFAHDRNQEAQAFAGFVEFAYAKLQADPSAHIYHYAPYEVSALNRLASRHGIMEAQVDWLITEGKLIDLYKVVRNSIMVSQPSYSIKKLEPLYGFGRDGQVEDAASSIEEYDSYRRAITEGSPDAQQLLQNIADYNQDDCVSTMALYDWLAAMPQAGTKYREHRSAIDRKKSERAAEESQDGAGSKAEAELLELQRATKHMAAVLETFNYGVSAEADYRATIWQALMHSVLYYKREEVVFWRDTHLRVEATREALAKDRKALVVDGCRLISDDQIYELTDPTQRVKALYSYHLEPGQAIHLKAGDTIFVRYDFGSNQQDRDYGTLLEVDEDQIVFERVTKVQNLKFSPNAIFSNDLVRAGAKNDSVRDYALALAAEWVSPLNEAPQGHPVLDLLMRRAPRTTDRKPLQQVRDADFLPAVIDAVGRLDKSLLAIQGPPGSGKTYLGSRAIAHLVANGKRVAVVANSHSAVENLLQGCLAAGVAPEQIAKSKKSDDKSQKPWSTPSNAGVISNWRAKQSGGYVVGGTAWTFSNQKLLARRFDYIFIDEAAQFALVDAIAVGQGSDNMVLLGDPRQLTQVVQAIHPGGVDNSALGHYMGEDAILPAEKGYFVEVTRRMHPAVNHPVSWLSYQGRLHSFADASDQCIDGLEPGLTLLPVNHTGNVSHSDQEVEVVLAQCKKLLTKVEQSEVLIVAPYNAQVDAIRHALDAAGLTQVEVGTVDKFQGREAMAVIVSLAASSAEDAPRGLEFLLDRNRLNVALSRAKTNSYLVYSPTLLRTRFNSVEDVKCVSRLAGLLEFANV